MWRLGFFFHEMAFGLLSIFLPLYVISPQVGGTLFDVGVLTAVAVFVAIPASFFWGFLCDKTRRYKRYILLSFLVSSIFLLAFTFSAGILLLIILYGAVSIFHSAHEAPKNVLVAELYSRKDWEHNFAFYEGFTEVGWLIGIVLGFFMSVWRIDAFGTLLLCGGLNLAAFAISAIFVTDPAMVFERSLVNIEKSVDLSFRGISIASKLLEGARINFDLHKENVNAFCAGLALYSLATSVLFTPMPIFISQLTQTAALPASIVFMIFALNSGGAVVGYSLVGRRSAETNGRNSASRVIILRALLSFMLMAAFSGMAAFFGLTLSTMILVLFGFANAVFLARTLSLSMELIPQGKAGLFNVLVGIGTAFGSFIGPSIAQALGFVSVFIVSGIIFLAAFVAFKIFA